MPHDATAAEILECAQHGEADNGYYDSAGIGNNSHVCYSRLLEINAANAGNLGPAGVGWASPRFNGCLYTNPSDVTCGYAKRVANPTPERQCPAGEALMGNYCLPVTQSCPIRSPEPISFLSGEKYLEETDYSGVGPLPLEITRYYSSEDTSWRFSYSDRLKSEGHNIVYVYMPDHSELVFVFNDDTQLWEGSSNRSADLTWDNVASEWTLAYLNGRKDVFDQDGYLVSRTNRNGQSITFARATVSGETTVTATHYSGRSMTVVYKEDSVIATDPAGNEYIYEYNTNYQVVEVVGGVDVWDTIIDTGAIKYVRYPDSTPANTSDNPTEEYLYETRRLISSSAGVDTTRPLVTGLIAEDGVRYSTYAYDTSNERALSSERAGGVEKTVVTKVSDSQIDVTNPLGRDTEYNFTNSLFTSMEGQASTYCPQMSSLTTYDSNYYVDTKTDENGVVTDYDYDANGLLQSRTDADGTVDEITTTFTWDTALRVKLSETSPGQKLEYTYDAQGRMLTEKLTDLQTQSVPYTTTNNTRITTYTYNAFGLVATVDGPRTDVTDLTTYDYDTNGDLKKVTNALGHVTEIMSRDARGLPTRVRDANSMDTDIDYDARGRVIEVKVKSSQGDAITQYEYDIRGLLTRVTLPTGGFVAYEYDTAQRLIAIDNEFSERIEYTLDNASNITKIQSKDSDGNVVLVSDQTFDELSRLRESVNALSQTTTYSYDDVGNETSMVDGLSRTTSQAYDALSRLESVTNAELGVTQYDYDGRGNLTTVTDPRGIVTTYVYDGLDNLIQESSPDAGTQTYVYDAAGNMTQHTDARGVVANYTYDALNRVLTTSYPVATSENITYTYDTGANGKGRLASISDESGSTTYTYDDRGNVLSDTRVISAQTYVTQYTYDLLDQMLTMTYPGGRVVTYTRDSQGRTDTVRHTLSGVTQYLIDGVQYGAHGLADVIAIGNGTYEAIVRDQTGRPTSRSLKDVNDSPPVAYLDEVTMNMGQTLDIAVLANDKDINGDSLTVNTFSQPSHGSTSLNGNQTIEYAPTASYTGEDTFTYQITDGTNNSNTVHVKVTVVDPGFVDTDGDGLSDALETEMGLDPNDASDAVADADGDGVDNYDEYLAGTDPLINDNGLSDILLGLSPTAYWKFDETSGSTLTDSSANGLNGSYAGTHTKNGTSVLESGQAVEFESGYTVVSHDASLELVGDYTITGLLRWKNSSWGFVHFKYSNRGTWISVAPGGLVRLLEDNSTILYSDSAKMNDNTWRHFAFVRRGDQLEIWINGVLDVEATFVQPTVTNGRQLFMAGRSSSSAYRLDGAVDDWAVLGSALTPAQIKAQFLSMGNKDLDTLPTSYELANGLDPTDANDATSDYDGDGATAHDEYVAGTDPRLNPLGYASSISADNPEAHWPLDDVTATAADASGNGHAGTYHTPYTQSETGAITTGDSVAFTGGRIVVPNDPALSPQGDYTIEGHYKWTGTGWFGLLFGINDGGSPHAGPEIFANYSKSGQSDGQVMVRDQNGSSYWFESDATNLNDGRWRHFAFVRRGGNHEIYIDGALDASLTLPSVNQHSLTTDLQMMGRATDWQVQGSADDVAFYKHALSAGDIRQRVYQGQQPPAVVSTQGEKVPGYVTRWLAQGDRILLQDVTREEPRYEWFEVNELYDLVPLDVTELDIQAADQAVIIAVRDKSGVNVYFEDSLDDSARQFRRLPGTGGAAKAVQVASSGLDITWTYTYDAVGNITQITKPGGSDVYTYDDMDRVDGYTLAGSSAVDYTYDLLGNRLTETESGVTQTLGYATTSNRLTTKYGNAVTYDAAGNTLTTDGGVRSYTYNNRNRMVSASDNGSVIGTYVYNAQGQRVKKTVGSQTTYYVYGLQGQLIGEYDQGTTIREYVYSDGLQLISQHDASGTLFVFTDHLGTPRYGTDVNRDVLWSWESDPFGEALPEEDVDGDLTDQNLHLRFPGQYYDGELGAHYNYFRTYDPDVGRYTQSDPIGLAGGINTYLHVDANPVNFFDLDGLLKSGRNRNTAEPFDRACIACMQAVSAPYGPMLVDDKYKHCVVGAEGTRKCGQVCAAAAAIGKEIIDLVDGKSNTNPEVADAVATIDGIECAKENPNCKRSDEDCCKDKGHIP